MKNPTPRTENATKNNMQRIRTFCIAGIEDNKACVATLSPSFLLIILNGRSALIALSAFRLFNDPALLALVKYSRYKSTIDITTTKKSNIFHPFLK